MTHQRLRRTAALFALPLVLFAAAACSDDDDPADPGDDPSVIGTWQATSLTALGTDFIAAGMTLTVELAETGNYTLTVTGDQVGFCEVGTQCERTGPYSTTATTLTLDVGEDEEVTLNYTVTASTMIWSGPIQGIPATATFARGS